MSGERVAEHRATRPLAGLIGAALLVTTVVSWVGESSPGLALGPVQLITPTETSPGLPEGYGPGLSYRGEVAGVRSTSDPVAGQTAPLAFVQFDVGGPDSELAGASIGVSDNGCRAAYTQDFNFDFMLVHLVDRCDPASSRVIARINGTNARFGRPALSADGRFVAMEYTGRCCGEFPSERQRVARIDTFNGDAFAVMPIAGLPAENAATQYGLDISNDGNVIATTMETFAVVGGPPPRQFVVTWDVGSGAVRAITDFGKGPTGDSYFPSVSGDGRFVSFNNTAALAGGETSGGPWVYVHDRATGGFQLVSPPDGVSFYSSITSDATQVAFVQFVVEQSDNAPWQVMVARSSVPGMTGGLQTELISALPNGQPAGGGHFEPALSGNGHFVAWSTNVAAQLAGVPAPDTYHAVIRRRDPVMAVSAADFGSLLVGTSANATVTVSNTGTTTLNPASFTPSSGAFVVQSGGSCFAGISLPPGGSCTLNVRFTAPPPSPSTVNATLTVSESGFQPVVAAGTLVGRVLPPGVTTTSTTTTTVPRVQSGPPTTRPSGATPVTTIPLDATFSADPIPVDFGQVAVGIASAAQTITVTNNGNGPFVFTTEMGGVNPDDFYVSDNQCNGVTLQPGATCTISVIMIALDGGDRVAEIIIRAGGASGGVELRGQGRFAPQLVASPGAVGVGGSTLIIGQGFPPDRSYEIHVGTTGIVLPVTADAAGRLVVPYPLPRSMGLGSYLLRVDALATVFEEVRGQLAVALPTFEPQGQNGPVFGTTMIVTRGS